MSPILSPEQDLTPGTNSPLRHVALNDKLSSSGTFNTSNSAFDLIFYRGKRAESHRHVVQSTLNVLHFSNLYQNTVEL